MSASPTPAAPVVSTAPPAPQPKGQRHRIVTPTAPYINININRPVVNARSIKAPQKYHVKLIYAT